jgi:pSer/pThr/pTyr-binding forkhead associated (FHA) protein
MRPAVTLTISRGPLKGKRLVFEEPAVVTVGRAFDCNLHVPSHDDYMDVSRHHAWFDINPPGIRVFDSGSRNGTYVNGVNTSDISDRLPISDLQDGDEVRIGSLVLQVGVRVHDSPADEARHAESNLALCV